MLPEHPACSPVLHPPELFFWAAFGCSAAPNEPRIISNGAFLILYNTPGIRCTLVGSACGVPVLCAVVGVLRPVSASRPGGSTWALSVGSGRAKHHPRGRGVVAGGAGDLGRVVDKRKCPFAPPPQRDRSRAPPPSYQRLPVRRRRARKHAVVVARRPPEEPPRSPGGGGRVERRAERD